MAMLLVMVPDFEGTELKPYKDVAGITTACTGHTGDVKWDHRYTPEECRALLAQDLTSSLASVDRLTKVPLSPKTRTAMADFVFNFGSGAYAGSTLLRRINAGEGANACPELLKWDKARVNGVLTPLPGLTRRREIEYWLCVEGFRSVPLPLAKPARLG